MRVLRREESVALALLVLTMVVILDQDMIAASTPHKLCIEDAPAACRDTGARCTTVHIPVAPPVM